ncbi:MAG: hypothetical protein HC911_10250 [Chloroflexaceae bacterium]|nr:hypothetical protein [Chloroflexaceae bacterium]
MLKLPALCAHCLGLALGFLHRLLEGSGPVGAHRFGSALGFLHGLLHRLHQVAEIAD